MGKVIVIVAAMTPDPDRVIGFGDTLPWNIPSDMGRFARITRGFGNVLMGRATFESLKGPLQGRQNLVMTRQSGANIKSQGGIPVHSPEMGVARAHGRAVCVIGGAEIYKLMLHRAEVLCMTFVYAPPLGNVRFPQVQWQDWKKIFEIPRQGLDPRDEYETSFGIYVRPGSVVSHVILQTLEADVSLKPEKVV